MILALKCFLGANYSCQNGGTCTLFSNNAICLCKINFTGSKCETYIGRNKFYFQKIKKKQLFNLFSVLFKHQQL